MRRTQRGLGCWSDGMGWDGIIRNGIEMQCMIGWVGWQMMVDTIYLPSKYGCGGWFSSFRRGEGGRPKEAIRSNA